jgi:hypothetical protein
MSDELGIPNLNKHIEIQAYYDWQTDGCRAGNDLEYWEQARIKVTAAMGKLTKQVTSYYEGGISAQPPTLPCNGAER